MFLPSFTRLGTQLPSPECRIETVPLFNVLLICILFFSLGSQFFFAPGVAIELPKISRDSAPGQPATVLLTVLRSDLLLLDGRVLPLMALESQLKTYLEEHKITAPSTLLLKADRSVPTQILLEVCEKIHRVGFQKIQLATDFVENS